MLRVSPLDALALQLKASVASFDLTKVKFGDPEAMKGATDQAAELFSGFAKAAAAQVDPYTCAMAFLRGATLNDQQMHVLAGALAKPLKELNGRQPLGLPSLAKLLDRYFDSVRADELSLLTWFGLLCSYFEFNPKVATAAERGGWEKLRAFLQRSWPLIDRLAGRAVVPDWIKVLRANPDLLSDQAADHYGLDFLNGDNDAVRALAVDLGIPEASWFWHLLIRSAIQQGARQPDEPFKALIPRLLSLLEGRPVFRDEGLALVLTRYRQCQDAPFHRQLGDYVVRKDVWRNPELRESGLAPAWNRVDESVWQMVLQWANEGNLRDFFMVLANRRDADGGRLSFWSHYVKQVSWTRFIFSPQTKAIAPRHRAIREMIEREDGAYAAFWGARGVDAFMMQIGKYLVVEFSTAGNAMVVYDATKLSFDRHALKFLGGTEELSYGFRGAAVLRVDRGANWQTEAVRGLAQLGIQPDRG